MARFSLLPLVAAAVFLGSTVSAAPWPIASKHATHRTRSLGEKRDLGVEAYFPESSFEVYDAGVDIASSKSDSGDKATDYVKSQLNYKNLDVRYMSGFTDSRTGVEHVYMKQYYNDVPIINTAANVAFKGDKVLSFGSSFVDIDASDMPDSSPSASLDSLLSSILSQVDGVLNTDITPSLGYHINAKGSPSLVHVAQIQNTDAFTWYQAYVDAHSGSLISVADFVNDLSYKVVPIEKIALPDGLETLEDPENLDASPDGWVANDNTAGNNVISYKLLSLITSSAPFDYTYDDSKAPSAGENVDAARVNAFYLINKLHDVWYEYGFTEETFNFQNDNYGKGGEDGDRVKMSVQDITGTNNANFATPPDGQAGQCRMYIWTQTTPNRDGTMDNSIPVHEYTHGLTNRLTGGGTGTCLQTNEAGGMGEGWSDAMAEWTELTSDKVEDYVLAAYVYGDKAGIRSVPYSTDHDVDPLMYSTIQELDEVHDIGEIWATVLHGVLASLVTEHGYAEDKFTNASGDSGNIVYGNLFLDALKLQPCNPTMPQARHAWIQADANKYDGAHKCLLWKAFADRGLGVGAADYVDSFDLPEGC